ncbi:MAG TPA: S9 family peptidase [Ignavibacteriaceae bacterium]|nr:S9 family peptidase [Ignavibacteriaceae bacterium]
MKNSKRIIFFAILYLLVEFSVFAQNKPYTMTDQVQLKTPSNSVISPNGDKVLFTIRKADLVNSKWITQVFLIDVNSSNYYQFTTNGKSCTSPAFSPDNKMVTFLSGREYLNPETKEMESEGTQIWAAPLAGGEAMNLTSFENGVDEYTWSHNGKLIAFLSDAKNEQREKEEALKKKLKTNEKVYPQTNPVKELKILEVETGKIISSLELDPGATGIKFSGDDKSIVYQTNYTGEYNDDQKYDIYSIDLNGNKKQLTNEKGPETSPAFSPEGNHIAYITQTLPDIEFAQTDLNIMNSDGSLKMNLTKDFDWSVNSFVWKDNNSIFFTVDERTNEQLYKITLSTGKIEKLTSGNMIISDISFSGKGDLCYTSESATSLNEIFVNNIKLTNFSSQLKKFNTGSQEVITYRSSDGKYDIDGILFKPTDFNKNKKYPLILTVHGGPYSCFKNTFSQVYGTKVWTDKGYVVFAPNPRGSSGYSDEFGQANKYDLGGGDYEDIMAGVDYLISKGFIDENKMGVTGGSYGGYLTNWIISQTNRFKAAVSMYGLFSLFTDWSNSVQPAWEKMYLGYYYWEKPIDKNNQYINRSPAFYVQNIKTPTLIMHGDSDIYTNVSNSREMYQALSKTGVPVEFVIYPGAGHGLRKEPNQYVNVVERATNWFEKYIPSR